MPKDTQLWLTEPETYLPQPSDLGWLATKRRLAPTATAAWQTHGLRHGAKGFLIAQVAAIRVYPLRAGLPGNHCWLLLRRHLDDPTEVHPFLSNAPADTPFAELLYVCTIRWPRPGGPRIIFEQAK